MSDHLRYQVEGGVASLVIDRPEKRNAMTYAMLADFLEQVERAAKDDAVRVLIVTGAGGAFCAGTDLADLATVPGERRGLRGRAGEAGRWWPLVACPKPVIAAVDGPAVGMGAEFTSQCDVRIVTPRARFAWNFAHRGLVPDTGAGTWLLPRLVGPARALRLLYSGEFLSGEEALAIGYATMLVEPDRLQAAAREMATSFLRGSPFSHRRMKELVYRGLERDVGAHMQAHVAALAECFASADHKEGVAAFLERREARFTGE
jgi:enoyl-CoA hydratase